MVIAVHDNLKRRNDWNSEHKFFQDLIRICCLKHPQDQFYFIGANTLQAEKYENLRFIGVEEPRFPFLRKKRYDKKIAKLLENIRADLFISNDGYYCKETRIPQIMIIHETVDLDNRKEDLEAAKSIIILNELTGTKIISTLKPDSNKIKNIHFGISDEIQPLNFEEQFIVKEDHTEGKEYFIAKNPLDKNILISLLKAFSIFKKRQQTNMMLLIVSDNKENSDSFYTILQHYKYREDVILKSGDETQKGYNLLGAAYAYIDMSPGSLIGIAEAMRSGVPVLTTEKARVLTENTVLYLEPLDQQQIAEQLMLIYKDETLRSDLINKAATIASEYTWDRTAELFWKAIGGQEMIDEKLHGVV